MCLGHERSRARWFGGRATFGLRARDERGAPDGATGDDGGDGGPAVSANRLRQRLAAGDRALGGWCTLPTLLGAELLAAAGFDYVCVDRQHGLADDAAMVAMLAAAAAAGATPVVRVAANDPAAIGRALDTGAEAVIVPMVNSRGDAERAVAACRYGPDGVRSFGPVRSTRFLDAAPPADADREVMCVVMIETADAVARANEICTTPGVDGVYVGPADLAVSMGLVPGPDQPRRHGAAVEAVLTACRSAGVVPGIHTTSGAEARRCVDLGFRMVSVSTDATFLAEGAAAHLRAAGGG